MANILSTGKQVAIIAGLAEGSSIRSLERVTGIHRDTIMRLGARNRKPKEAATRYRATHGADHFAPASCESRNRTGV